MNCSFYLCWFHKYMPYGFPIVNFCIQVERYEKPRISFNHLECSVSYITTTMCMLTKAPLLKQTL